MSFRVRSGPRGVPIVVIAIAMLVAGCSAVAGIPSASSEGLIHLRAATPGTVPEGDTITIGGITLRSGRPIRNPEAPGTSPVGWLSVAPATVADWAVIAAEFPATGLWPVLVRGLDDESGLDRPWLDGEFDRPGSADGIDVADFLQEAWARQDERAIEYADESIGPWLGLAAGSPGPAEFRVPADLAATTDTSPGLLLVPAARPADVVGALGWLGATNYWAPGEVSAVLRSWEDRFGAVLMHMDFDSIYLVVQRPPTGPDEINRTAGEHMAFVPDMIWQESDSYEQYRDESVPSQAWFLWWD